MSQEEIINDVYQQASYGVSVTNADEVVSKVLEEKTHIKKKAINEMLLRINKTIHEFYFANSNYTALSVDVKITEQVARESEYIEEIKNFLVESNWNVRVEGESYDDMKFVIRPRNWFVNKKDQHGKRGKQKPSFLTTIGIIIIVAIVVGIIA